MNTFQKENEKNKEIKETTETESYDEYENEAMENAENGSLFEEVLLSKSSLPFGAGQIAGSISSSEKEIKVEESLRDSYEERKKAILDKWFTVTGKKPRNIPTVKRYFDEPIRENLFFGDRCPSDREKRRVQKIMLESKKIQSVGIVYGKVRQEIRMPPLSQGLQCIRLSPDSEFMATTDRQGLAQVRKFPTGEVTLNLKTLEMNERLPVKCLKYYPRDSTKLFLGGQAGMMEVFSTESGELIDVSHYVGMINTIDINADGSALALGGKEGNLRVFDPFTLQEIWAATWPNLDENTNSTVEDEYHRLRIFVTKFHPIETYLFATGSCDHSVKIWDVRVPKAIRSIRGPFILGEGLDISGDKIITASWRAENSLNLWDFHSGNLIKDVPLLNKRTKYEGDFLYSAAFFKDDSDFSSVNSAMVAVGGSGFLELIIINVETHEVLAYFPSFKATVTLDIIGNTIVYGGKESVFRVAEVESKRKTRPHLL